MNQFLKDVNEGLSNQPKRLLSKYFYDEIGDKLFVDIMNMPEYYLTNSELEIFQTKSQEMINAFGLSKNRAFEIVELGAGDGTKTLELLKVLVEENYPVTYVPVDISQHALDGLQQMLKVQLTDLAVLPKQGDYFEVLNSLKSIPKQKIVLFLGSNIGNLTDERSKEFIEKLGENLNFKDQLLIGVDLIKSREIVLPAYNDEAGITRAFNLNLLTRINKELGGNFDLNKFDHYPEYTEEEGIAKSSLISLEDQEVEIKVLDKTFSFKKEEKIHTEISRKYNDQIIKKIIDGTPFTIRQKLTDSKQYFADYIMQRN